MWSSFDATYPTSLVDLVKIHFFPIIILLFISSVDKYDAGCKSETVLESKFLNVTLLRHSNRVSKIIRNEYWCGYLASVTTEIWGIIAVNMSF